ncbi:Glycosyltransferase involved in cell wall bisynthesis [Opitutus sp. GAS368]|nr:Glycosyltransferase involved in cell wall bisynthesis [Opitutus sp. GAS368]
MNASTLIGEIESPRPLRAAGGRLSVVGWCVARGESFPPPVRLVAGPAVIPLGGRHERADVATLLPGEKAAGRAGFTLEGSLPAGIHLGRFEAQLPDGRWRVFKELTIAAEAAPFVVVLDEPISEGTLRDRVKVGGWALDPVQPVAELSLHYGHRRIACVIGRTRTDVPAAFPEVAHAGRAGFMSEDFLVAGHGPVRARALLADGRAVVAATKVSFSVATDENHEPELDLTAARIGLEHTRAPRAADPAVRVAHPLNVLFILPGSFASNNALHVAALANELAAAGHACAVAVAHDKATLQHLDRPAFRGLTHADARNDPDFPDRRGPDIIHAWTTRENVRLLAEQLRSRHASRLIVHLEDNEQQVLALSLGRSVAEIAQLDDAELARLVPADLSHPRLSRGFLAKCDAVTVILDRLREFVPPGKSCLTLPPAADGRHYYPRPVPAAFRAALRLAPDTTVLFYHGNVHASNAAEMRELYAAVLELNRTGTPVTLIRTGLDRVDFLGGLATAVAPHVLALGQVTHHHHLPPLMALADVFVQPGGPDAFNDYRFPSKLPEFFSLGRPVVLPRTNLGIALRHGVDAWVLDRADAAGIAGAVRVLRADPALREKLGQGAAAYATAHFSWRRSAEALAKFYRTLAVS